MPAAAVIPAPLAYIKVAAVKKLVVGSRDRVGVFPAVFCGSRRWESSWAVGPVGEVPGHAGVPPRSCSPPLRLSGCPSPDARPGRDHFTLNKSECSKQAPFARTLAHGIMEEDPLPLLLVSRRQVMIKRDGRGRRYVLARGEILGPWTDPLERKHPPRMFPLIKNESRGIEPD